MTDFPDFVAFSRNFVAFSGNFSNPVSRIFIRFLGFSGDENNGTRKCFKCLSIVSRSPNVLQIHTNGGVDRCHPTEEEARAQCPTGQQVSS